MEEIQIQENPKKEEKTDKHHTYKYKQPPLTSLTKSLSIAAAAILLQNSH